MKERGSTEQSRGQDGNQPIKYDLNTLLQSYTNYFPIMTHIFHFCLTVSAMTQTGVEEGSFQYVRSERVAHV